MALAVLPLLAWAACSSTRAGAGVGEGRAAGAAHHRDGEILVARVCAHHPCWHRSFAICGMSWFDAICHAFSAVGLGGFSTHDLSIAYFAPRRSSWC